MKFTNKILTILLLTIAVAGVSCKKYLDVNKSPLTATKVDSKQLFGYAITAWDVNKNSGDNYTNIGFIGQSLASGGNYSFNWGASNLYDVSTNTLGNVWKVYYSTGGNNLYQAIQSAEASTPVQNNTAAQCKIMLAQFMYEATCLYGDVPYSQAFQPEKFPYPKYDAQKDVLEGVLKLLNDAKAQIDPASPLKIADYDIFYGGNMNKWILLANSIKLRVLMTMVDADPTKAAEIGNLVTHRADSLINSAADSWITKYSGNTNNENPKYRLFLGEDPATFASKVITDIMISTTPGVPSDPRLPQYFDVGPDAAAGEFIGVGANEDADTKTSEISQYLLRKNAPSVELSFQEMEFFEAEVYARGLGVSQDLAAAETLFKKAVTDGMTFYEADPAAITAFVNNPLALPNISTLSSADAIKQIHLQQWVDLMDRPLEAFIQWERSGPDGQEVPALTLPLDATPGPLFRRYLLSPDETAANPNIPNPQPKYYDKVWFDK